jgi:transcriptional antiterminator NusG
MVMNDDTWYVVRNTRGVTGFVGPGSKPVPLEEGEVEKMSQSMPGAVIGFETGDMVTVVSGVWEGTIGKIRSINESKQCVTINVDMFGRETPVDIPFEDIHKM